MTIILQMPLFILSYHIINDKFIHMNEFHHHNHQLFACIISTKLHAGVR